MELKPLKVLIVSTYDFGGAANACVRLHKGLLKSGVNSKLLLKQKQSNVTSSYVNDYVRVPTRIEKLKQKLIKKLPVLKIILDYEGYKRDIFVRKRDSDLEFFTFPDSNVDITESKLYKESDIVNLHWVAGFMDFESFFKKNTKPVVWTLHDMNPFTGGEHYSEMYKGISASGLPVKRKLTTLEQRVFQRNIKIKLKALSNVSHLHIVAPSKWLFNASKTSEVFKKFKTHLIPYGLDETDFKKEEKEKARKQLGLPIDKTIILFVAHTLNNNRKGFSYLKQALAHNRFDDLVLCSIGKAPEIEERLNTIHLGEIKDNSTISKVYSAADVFVIPSIMDNLPNTVLESLFCGTPVIGFPVGGIPDMVEHGVNGYLTKEISVAALIDTLHLFLGKSKHFDANQIRNNAIKKYSDTKQSEAYIKLFKSLI